MTDDIDACEDMTDEEFDKILAEILDEHGKPSALLSIRGVYEVVSEMYHNAVLDRWLKQKRENERSNA